MAQTEKTAVRPFRVNIPESELAELKRRIKATRWPDPETVPDASQGSQLLTMQALAQYWSNGHDWRKAEARLNAHPQFITEIDGLDIHFLHVKSKHEHALPVIITHGWPGSVLEQLKIIEPLTNPTAHGGMVEDAFHVVIPSMPGYGFSGRPTTPGWGPDRISRAWVTLMKRLGYTQFVAQGGDWGALIVDVMGAQAAPELLGIHTNMPGAVPPEIMEKVRARAPVPTGLGEDERRAYERLSFFFSQIGYALEMSTRPQSLTALADSPVGLAAWMIDHDLKSYELIARAFRGQREGISRDDVLDNVTLFWVTNTAISAARMYWENKHEFLSPMNVAIPVAVSAFPDELYQCPKSWAERAYRRLVHYNKLDRGGHFAAWEQPTLLVQEMRAGFRPMRRSHGVHRHTEQRAEM